jgi:hypothetical protein
MSSRFILKVLALAVALSTMACTQRTIIVKQDTESDGSESPHLTAVATDGDDEAAIAKHALYVRSANSEPGEQEQGPHPEPWQAHLGPHPEPWHHQASTGGTGGSTDSPPDNDTDTDTDPNPNP